MNVFLHEHMVAFVYDRGCGGCVYWFSFCMNTRTHVNMVVSERAHACVCISEHNMFIIS